MKSLNLAILKLHFGKRIPFNKKWKLACEFRKMYVKSVNLPRKKYLLFQALSLALGIQSYLRHSPNFMEVTVSTQDPHANLSHKGRILMDSVYIQNPYELCGRHREYFF